MARKEEAELQRKKQKYKIRCSFLIASLAFYFGVIKGKEIQATH